MGERIPSAHGRPKTKQLFSNTKIFNSIRYENQNPIPQISQKKPLVNIRTTAIYQSQKQYV